MSGFLLDTNVPSETLKPVPSAEVLTWLASQNKEVQFLSAVTVGELRRGSTLLAHGARRTELEYFIEIEIPLWFGLRILSVTRLIADRWGVIDGTCQLRGTPVNTADGLIAATAAEHGLTVVTRNVKDFALFGVSVFNPWEK